MDPVSLALGAMAFISAVGGSIAGVAQLNKLRLTQQAIAVLNEQLTTQANEASIQQAKQTAINNILLNTAIDYKKASIVLDEQKKQENLTLGLFSASAIMAAIGVRLIIKKAK